MEFGEVLKKKYAQEKVLASCHLTDWNFVLCEIHYSNCYDILESCFPY
jgi:hypothetical protein